VAGRDEIGRIRRDQQQRFPRHGGQPVEVGGVDPFKPLGQRQDVIVDAPGPGELDQRQRVARSLREHPHAKRTDRRRRLGVEHRRSRERVQRTQRDQRKADELGLVPRTDQHRQRLVADPPRDELQHVPRPLVDPPDVVHHDQHRHAQAQLRQQREHRHPDDQPVRWPGAITETNRAEHSGPLPFGEPVNLVQHRPQELVQPGERKRRLAAATSDPQHPPPSRPGIGSEVEQRARTRARFTGDDQHAAGQPQNGGVRSCPAPGVHPSTVSATAVT
jgi:hypothetical protein